jgi:hypothetical protein
MRRLLLIIASSSAVIVFAMAVGVLRHGLTTPRLERRAERSVARCMHEAGFGHVKDLSTSHAEEQARSSQTLALERCWSIAAKDEQFARLGLTDPIAYNKQLREKGLKDWRCVEKSYVRATRIPLSGPGGYPLQLAAGNFRVGSSERDLERFYSVAADCSGAPIESYRWSDGTFSPDPADGVSHCIRHQHHGSGLHSHGCYGLATYPAPNVR